MLCVMLCGWGIWEVPTQAGELPVAISSLSMDTTSDSELEPMRRKPTLRVAGDVYCPYSGCLDKIRKGFMVDLVDAVYGTDYRIEYAFLPWSRAVRQTQEGQFNAILGIVKITAPDLLYPKLPATVYRGCFFTKRHHPWTYQGIASLRSIKLLLVQDFGYGGNHPEFADYIAHNKNDKQRILWIAGQDNLNVRLRMLVAGRVDAFAEDYNIVRYHLLQTGRLAEFKSAGCNERVPGYIGFNRNIPDAQQHANQWDTEITKLRASGKLARLLEPYGVGDWLND
ncbi:ABC transporter, periplasmic domain [Oleiphilus messinensis]|uniref:ABC transporter, periplasmic domain n=1 Tax=Oleiphilus messinensis TaxID=141451 RepID=A0A1Y0IEL9_9GAMM|nr:ABC transporter substrate-binding protein [Oleiphilus messinensis]ARU58962.1 ABC transporter, periplasmic domain [Oleiphilus messinensis]